MKKSHETRGVLRRIESPQSMPSKQPLMLIGIGEQVTCHTRLQKTGQDAITPNATRPVFRSQALCQSDEARLGCGIIGLSSRTTQSAVGADVKDVALTLSDHQLQRCLRGEKGTFQMHLKHLLKVGLGHFHYERVARESSIVNEQVEPRQHTDPPLHLSFIRDIHLSPCRRMDPPALGFQLRPHRLRQITSTAGNQGHGR